MQVWMSVGGEVAISEESRTDTLFPDDNTGRGQEDDRLD